MSQAFWRDAGTYMFYGLTGVSVLFVLMYLVLSPWWKTETGRNIMAVMGSLASTLAYFTVAVWMGHTPFAFYQARFFLFLVLALAIGWRVVLFVRAQLLNRSNKEKQDG